MQFNSPHFNNAIYQNENFRLATLPIYNRRVAIGRGQRNVAIRKVWRINFLINK